MCFAGFVVLAVFYLIDFSVLLLARLMGKYCFARWRLSSSVTLPAGGRAGGPAAGRVGGRVANTARRLWEYLVSKVQMCCMLHRYHERRNAVINHTTLCTSKLPAAAKK